jgi:hypothetical protein
MPNHWHAHGLVAHGTDEIESEVNLINPQVRVSGSGCGSEKNVMPFSAPESECWTVGLPGRVGFVEFLQVAL